MFDKSVFKSGRHWLLPEIDYGAVPQADIYYKKILCKDENIVPDFCPDIDVERVLTTAQAGNESKLTQTERNFVRLQRLVARNNPSRHHELLTKMEGYLTAYPNDSNLKVICAKALFRREKYSDAARLLHGAIFTNPENGIAHALMGLLAALANDHGTAIRCAREALRLGQHLYHTQSKALVFTLLAMGTAARVGAFDASNLLSSEQNANKFNQCAQNYIVHTSPDELDQKPVVLIACDGTYFNEFAKSLLTSLIPCSSNIICHIHIIGQFNGFEKWVEKFQTKFGDQIIVSSENTSDPALLRNKSYLASNRFINLPNFMEQFDRPYVVLDADSILINPNALRDLLKDQEKTILYFAELGPIWDRISAPFLFQPNNSDGLAFASKCAAYLTEKFYGPEPSSFWYIDQLALLGGFVNSPNSVDLCPAGKLTDVHCGEDAIFWTLSNDKKHPKYIGKVAELEEQYPI